MAKETKIETKDFIPAISQDNLKSIYKCLLLTPGISTGSESSFTLQNIYQEQNQDIWGIPFTLMGDPGLGKSSIVKAICRELGLPCFSIIAAIRDPTSFSGIPVLREVEYDTGIQKYENDLPVYNSKDEPVTIKKKIMLEDKAIPADFFEISQLKHAVINFDEVSTAPAAVQAALLTVFLERKIGNFQLASGVRMTATANRSSQAANGSSIALPLANRMAWFQVPTPSVEEWKNYVLSDQNTSIDKTKPYLQIQTFVKEKWQDALVKAKGLVIAFINGKRELGLFSLPKEGADEIESLTYPTPRSWMMSIHALAGAFIHQLNKESIQFMISGIVGSGLGLEFMSFMKNIDIPDACDVLDGKVEFKHNKDRLDISYAVISSCQALLLSMHARKTENSDFIKLFKSRIVKMMHIIEHVQITSMDIALIALRTVTSLGHNTDPEVLLSLTRLSPIYSELQKKNV